MEQFNTTIRFTSPGFLGDAQQAGAWRAPPFKAELRRWWRVAMAARGVDLPRMREREGGLFGDAAGEGGRRSRVRVRLSEWRAGRLKQWSPEGGSRGMIVSAGGQGTAADLYLGYGRLKSGGRGNPNSALEGDRPAIAAGETGELRLAWPADEPGAEAIPQALGLMHRLGSVGGRTRNGWGSYVLDGAPPVSLADFAVDWRQAVEVQWAHALGKDKNGLLAWLTSRRPNWEGVIRDLGQIRKDLCAETPVRPLLSYPVTKHNLREWDASTRVPNTLRFKVVPDNDGLRGMVFHMPCRPADELWKRLPGDLQRRFPEVWRAAHELLDGRGDLQRVTQ